MRDVRELCQQRTEALIAERQRIAARQNDFLDAVVGGDRGECLLPAQAVAVRVGVRKLAPETVTAVNRAGAGGDQQHTMRVFLQQAAAALRARFLQRVRFKAR